jgi:tRNA pseudouridine55 synthase
MNKIIIVNKESGMTSRDVVNKLNKILGTKKIGHTGTLDPIASGVLVICVGKYTKLVDHIVSLDKEYIATVKLGILTDTLDITGNVLDKKDYHTTESQIKEVFNSFIGSYLQEVPKYSAVKINGKKLYEYARENIEINLPKREVSIYELELLEFNKDGFKFRTKVSKGTYIRSLINDICNKLNTYGTMADLIRTKQGKFSIEEAYSLEDIENNNYKSLNIEEVLDLKVLNLNDSNAKLVMNGNKLNLDIEDGDYLIKINNQDEAIYSFLNKEGKIKIKF